MSQVNLLPPELVARQKTRRLTSAIIVAGAAAVALLVAFAFYQQSKLSAVNSDIATQNARNAGLQQQIAGLQNFQQLQNEAAAKQRQLGQAFVGEVSFSGLLMDLSRVIPSDAYLTSFSAALSTTPVTGATGPTFAGSFTAGGGAAGVDSLASWLTRLESVRGWVNPWLSSIQETKPSSRLYTFSSGADLSSDALTPRGGGATAGGG